MSELMSTAVSRVIDAPGTAIYQAFLDPDALAAWLPPDTMKGVVHAFEGREGGTFRIRRPVLLRRDDDNHDPRSG